MSGAVRPAPVTAGELKTMIDDAVAAARPPWWERAPQSYAIGIVVAITTQAALKALGLT